MASGSSRLSRIVGRRWRGRPSVAVDGCRRRSRNGRHGCLGRKLARHRLGERRAGRTCPWRRLPTGRIPSRRRLRGEKDGSVRLGRHAPDGGLLGRCSRRRRWIRVRDAVCASPGPSRPAGRALGYWRCETTTRRGVRPAASRASNRPATSPLPDRRHCGHGRRRRSLGQAGKLVGLARGTATCKAVAREQSGERGLRPGPVPTIRAERNVGFPWSDVSSLPALSR